MVVMLLGGLWHGASWNFVIWGGLHGGMLALERLGGKDSAYRRLPRPLRVAATFLIVCLGWVFFRAETLPEAGQYLASLVGTGQQAAGFKYLGWVVYTPYHALVFFSAAVIVWAAPHSWAFTRDLSPVRAAALVGMLLLAVVFMWTQTENPFLYFRF
jgi:alginate O-acetyltransferase complex protein AlgI